MPENDFSSVVPAQLSFLAIYNPLLGPTDETIHEQVVFYTSRSNRVPQHGSSTPGDDTKGSNVDKNEKLRHIGLAQGMVNFARNFSEGKSVDYVETERSQIVMHELEKDWWILASVDLTRLPIDSPHGSSAQRDAQENPSFQYSSREMTPPQLLIQQLRRAHSIFLLHHAPSLSELYSRVGRSTFCILIENFWLRFTWNWDILLNGNPAVDIFDGLKLSAGGELGIGVGEEEWGSGEREVLEDFISRTEGLVDIVVSRFGDPCTPAEKLEAASERLDSEQQWLGSDTYPRPSDGVIFSGVGAIARPCLVRITQWVEWIYRYGYDAYGVGENPTSARRRKRRKRQRGRTSEKSQSNTAPTDGTQDAKAERPFSPGIPRPLVRGMAQPPQPTQEVDSNGSLRGGETSPAPSERGSDWMGMGVGTDTFVKYLTLGYGSTWGFSSGASTPHPRVEALKREEGSSLPESSAKSLPDPHEESSDQISRKPNANPSYKNRGRFIIGLHDGTANPEHVLEETESTNSADRPNEKIAKRTLYVQLAASPEQNSTDSVELRVVIYMHQPFIYIFLFSPTTPSLSEPSLYHIIHHQLGPLQKPLSNSTSPENAALRVSANPGQASDVNRRFSNKNSPLPVYDLVYDPSNLTIRSSIPNIPDLGSPFQNPTNASPPWSRVESINLHHRLLGTYIETRSRPLETERTCKTSRGWWVVWVRMPAPSSSPSTSSYPSSTRSSSHSPSLSAVDPNIPTSTSTPYPNPNTNQSLIHTRQEAFLVRKASDHISSSPSSSHARSNSSSRFFRDLGGASSSPASWAADTSPSKLVEGLGLDARRYIENLLSLNK